MTRDLHELTKKDAVWNWSQKCQTSFKNILKAFANEPILSHYEDDAEYEIRTDSSDKTIAAILIKIKNNVKSVVRYESLSLKGHQINWHINRKEFYAVYWALCISLKIYIYGKFVTIYCDSIAVKNILNAKKLNVCLSRQIMEMQAYEFKILHKRGKENCDVDMISRLTKVYYFNIPKTNKIIYEQQDDNYCKNIIKQLNNSDENLPVNKHFCVLNGILHKHDTNNNVTHLQVVLPQKMIPELLISYHDAVDAGHFGSRITYEKIRDKYFFEDMKNIIYNYCKSCENCQLSKPSRLLKSGISGMLKASRPFERFHIDICGPFVKTENKKKYIVCAIDQFSKFIEMKAIKNQNSYTIAKFIKNNIICRYGPPRFILSDRGAVFLSNIVKSVIDLYPPTEQQFTSGFHPQCNANVERVQGTIKNILKPYVNIKENDWDLYLPHCQLAYNTKIHETTKYSPFELLFNFKPDSVFDIENNPNINVQNEIFSEVAKEKYAKQIAEAKIRLDKKQKYNAQRVNDKLRSQIFIVGDIVKLKNRSSFLESRKLNKNYEGPYVVLKRNSIHVYTNQSLINHKKRLKVNVEHLEHFVLRDSLFENTQNDSDSDGTEIYNFNSDDENLNNNFIPESTDVDKSSSDETEIYEYVKNISANENLRNREILRKPDRYGAYISH
ncbi:pol polyprotein-like protein [Leptotrombidium deliense]|uniref:RNA-directed DNA polymerase n=1 Tax=Leptotrombidium deliense TaxID=299467 RepID=A0A443S8F0_9ACAR|nr:pol polyprotein-like protein [Leptotrombidium deliense]